MSSNFYELLQERALAEPGRPCLALPDGQVYSYGDMDTLSARFAALLLECGVAPGDRVAVQVDKSPAAVAVYLACLRTGAVLVPMNTAYTPAEVGYFLGDAEPKVFFCRPGSEADLAEAAAAGRVAHVLPLGTSNGSPAWVEALRLAPAETIAGRGPDDPAAIVYTSGTTGRSKGAVLSHQNLSSNALTLYDLWGWRQSDVLLHALPIFHVHGLFVALHCAMLGASKVLFQPAFDVQEVRRGLKQASVLMGVPTFYTRLLALPDFGREDCRHMRLFISGSAPLTEATHKQFTERTGHMILERYGMSEAGMITSNPLEGRRVAGTVGFALPGVDVRIAAPNGAPCAPGEVGIIEARGPNLFSGYWRRPEKTKEEFRDDGYFITGDMAFMDTEGRVTIVGRAKDLVVSGGYNIYPKEIEDALGAIPGVAEAAVIGVPHPDLGEGLVAVLVAKGDPVADQTIADALADKLARFKQPRHVVWLDALPRNAMGKIQKNELRAAYADAFGA